MKKWNSFYEYVKVPLQLILVVLIVQNICGFFLSDSFSVYWDFSDTIYQQIALIILNFSTRILEMAPLLIGMQLLYKRFQNFLPSLALLTLVVLNFSFSESFVYSRSSFAALLAPSHLLAAGTLQVIFFSVLVNFIYKLSQSRSKYSFMSFITRDFWFILNFLFVGSISIGLWTFVLPYLISFIEFVVKLIAYDISNPISLFVYGILERVFSLLNISRLIRNPFLFSAAGGAWIDAVGNNYLGDIGIWTAQIAQNIFGTGAGRFITPNYIITIFIVPAIIFSIYQKSKDKIDRKKTFFILLVLSLFSLLGNTLLPLEVLLLFMAPLLLVFHYVYIGMLYALLPILNIFIGYASSNKTVYAMGNIFDFMLYNKINPGNSFIPTIFIVGVLSFITYYLAFSVYYNKFTLDLFQTGKQIAIIEQFIDICGGINNIKMLTNTAFAINISFNDDHLVEFQRLPDIGTIKVTETRFGYSLILGARSFIISKTVLNEMKNRI